MKKLFKISVFIAIISWGYLFIITSQSPSEATVSWEIGQEAVKIDEVEKNEQVDTIEQVILDEVETNELLDSIEPARASKNDIALHVAEQNTPHWSEIAVKITGSISSLLGSILAIMIYNRKRKNGDE